MNKTFKKMYDTCVKLAKQNRDLHERTGRSQVAAAVMAKSGKIYYGLNIGWWHSVCAEPVALSNAWMAGEREMQYVIAVKYNMRTGDIECLSPCGICREMFNNLQPEIKIILRDEKGECVVKTMDEMLPDVEDFDNHE